MSHAAERHHRGCAPHDAAPHEGAPRRSAPGRSAPGNGPGPVTTAPAHGPDLLPGGARMERVLARETSSSRAFAAVIAAILVIGLCGYALLETAVRAVGQPPWLIDTANRCRPDHCPPTGVAPLLLGVTGAVVFAAGLFFFLNAVLPGGGPGTCSWTRVPPSWSMTSDRLGAGAACRLAANVTQEQVMVVVSRRQVLVNVPADLRVPLREADVQAAVEAELRAMAPSPMPEVRVNPGCLGGDRRVNGTPRILNRILIGVLGAKLLVIGALLVLLATVARGRKLVAGLVRRAVAGVRGPFRPDQVPRPVRKLAVVCHGVPAAGGDRCHGGVAGATGQRSGEPARCRGRRRRCPAASGSGRRGGTGAPGRAGRPAGPGRRHGGHL